MIEKEKKCLFVGGFYTVYIVFYPFNKLYEYVLIKLI